MKFPSLRAGRLLPVYDGKQQRPPAAPATAATGLRSASGPEVPRVWATPGLEGAARLGDSGHSRLTPGAKRASYASPLAPSRSTGRHSIIRRVLCVLLLLGRLRRFHKA